MLKSSLVMWDGNRVKLRRHLEFVFEGARLNYRVLGQGNPVVLLHGSMVADAWGGFEFALARKYKVYVPELPGFGASETVPNKIHDTDLFAKAFASFMEHEGLQKVPVIAFSLGCVVAIKAAVRFDTRGKLILVGMPIRLESKLLPRIMALPLAARRVLAMNELARGGLLLSVLKDIIGVADSSFAVAYLQKLRTTDIRAMVDCDLIEEVEKQLPWLLSRVSNEMVFAYGEKDGLKRGADKWLGKPIVEIHGGGHDVFVTAANETMKFVDGQLAKKQNKGLEGIWPLTWFVKKR